MRRTTTFLLCAAALAGLPLAAAAQGSSSGYEPQQRLRTPLDTCMKTEVMRDAYCVKKCEKDFRLDLSGPKARCVALKPDAKYKPPEPAYKPDPNAKRTPQGGQG
jgi:hypothetical protein